MFHSSPLPRLPRFSTLPVALATFLVAAPLQAAPAKSVVIKRVAPKSAVAKIAPNANSQYLLGPEDVLDISVSNHPDLNASVTVRPDGRITLSRAGELTARGKSARTLALEIQRILSRTLNNARVQVLVKQARVTQVRITGAVLRSGPYPIRNGARLMDLVGAAGGLSTKPTRITGRLIRANRVLTFDMNRAASQPGSAANLTLLPDDLVILDAQDFAGQITVTGNVAKPGVYDLDEDLTITTLLAQAGGPSANAALRKSTVLRGGKPILTDLSGAILGNLPADSPLSRFQFKPGDMVVVPENQLKFGIAGEVLKPAYYPLPEDADAATVLRALALAGGVTPEGDLSEATITRIFNGQTKVLSIDAEAMYLGKAPDNVRLQDDDVLLVPKRDKVVSVIGQVTKPGDYQLRPDTTLISLLAQAGNPIKGAGLSRAYILRDGAQIPLNLRPAVVENKVDASIADFRLQRNDKLVIPDVSELVQVNGQVERPGAYSLDDDLSISSLLAKAGRPTGNAALSQAFVQRGSQMIPLDLRDANLTAANFRFEPGDALVVPENKMRFAVMGEVLKPGNYVYPENARDASVLNALNIAGGPTSGPAGGNLSRAGVLRTVNGKSQIIPINLNNLLQKADTSENIQLQPDDVFFIPPKKKGFNLVDLLGPVAAIASIGRGY